MSALGDKARSQTQRGYFTLLLFDASRPVTQHLHCLQNGEPDFDMFKDGYINPVFLIDLFVGIISLTKTCNA